MFPVEICKDGTFLHIPWSVRVMKSLERLKRTRVDELSSLWSIVRRHLWVPPLLEASTCFSFRIRGGGGGGVSLPGFRWASEHVTSIWLDPRPSLPRPPLLCFYNAIHTHTHTLPRSLAGLACTRERAHNIPAEHEANVNRNGRRLHGMHGALRRPT